uniref:LRP2-binding protein n=2 Tax=Macrostomum lignano TaxID=282301 RepID=A0A1I8GWY5_9PLAT
MESLSRDLPGQKLPISRPMSHEVELLEDHQRLSETELVSRLERVLRLRMERGDSQAAFQLGQLLFEQSRYDESRRLFEIAVSKFEDTQAMFQLGVIHYDGLVGEANPERGIRYMMEVCKRKDQLPSKQLYFAAAYNIGRAYFQGYGVRQNDEKAEEWWLAAADDGNPRASVLAQTTLGYFYSHADHRDLQKAFFWHSEACGNGSLESQGALGVMYLYGLGVRRRDSESAFECLREAAERGNVYAQGNMVYYYYSKKLFTKAAELAARVVQYDDIAALAEETQCQARFVSKGVALASFIFARCLQQGLGVQKDLDKAKHFYSLSFQFDPDTCARLQNLQNVGQL